MAIPDFIREFIQLEPETRTFWLELGRDLGFFLLALLLNRFTPSLVKWLVWRFAPQRAAGIYTNLVAPIENLFRIAGTLILVSLSLQILQSYETLHGFLGFFFDLALIAGIGWLLSRLFRQFVRAYGIDLIRRLGREVNELLLIVETVANVMIGFLPSSPLPRARTLILWGCSPAWGLGAWRSPLPPKRPWSNCWGRSCSIWTGRSFQASTFAPTSTRLLRICTVASN